MGIRILLSHLMSSDTEEPPPGCPLCLQARLSVEHIMLRCPQLGAARRRNLSIVNNNREPTMKQILEEIRVEEIVNYLRSVNA